MGRARPRNLRRRGAAPRPRAIRALGTEIDAPPSGWQNRWPVPRRQKVCYRRKVDAMRSFLDWGPNMRIVERWGGADIKAGPSEFDSINARYGLKGKRKARSIADAVWAVMKGSGPAGAAPFCIDNVDLDLLNATSPGAIYDGFSLPDYVQDHILDKQIEEEGDRLAVDEYGRSDCFVRYRSGGRYVKRRARSVRGRERACVCRDDRGRFAKCNSEEVYDDDVPF